MIISGAFLAFYAYIGFEDMVNLAEETNLPGQTISRSIYIAVLVSTILYVFVASRILYGLRHPLKWMNFLSVINKKTQTPINATVVVAIIISLLVSLFPIKTLAASTSFIILIVFTLINLSLISYRIKNREIHFRYLTIPIIASISNIVFLAFTAFY